MNTPKIGILNISLVGRCGEGWFELCNHLGSSPHPKPQGSASVGFVDPWAAGLCPICTSLRSKKNYSKMLDIVRGLI